MQNQPDHKNDKYIAALILLVVLTATGAASSGWFWVGGIAAIGGLLLMHQLMPLPAYVLQRRYVGLALAVSGLGMTFYAVLLPGPLLGIGSNPLALPPLLFGAPIAMVGALMFASTVSRAR
jgi:hypothetical protein